MPLYHFHVRNSDYFDDDEGVYLPDDRTARAHAIQVVHELQKADEVTWRAFTMQVKRDGRVIWEIPFEVSRSADPSC
jgi:hypothetical protein